MKINELNQRIEIEVNVKLKTAFTQFQELLIELRNRELTDKIVIFINLTIDEINAATGEKLYSVIEIKQSEILESIEKELNIVPKNYYRKKWLALGMAVFGIPIGVVFGAIIGNMAFLGVGLPLGLVVGMAFGSKMDKKAMQEGRQLDIEFS